MLTTVVLVVGCVWRHVPALQVPFSVKHGEVGET